MIAGRHCVAIVQTRMTYYRIPLFEILREKLHDSVNLIVVHGIPNRVERLKNDSGEITWAHKVRTYRLSVGGTEIVWQPYGDIVKVSDLVIVTQENRLLMNYWLLVKRHWTRQKIAFWGHGRNFQSSKLNCLKEIWKNQWIRRPDWWFAYTDFTRQILLQAGYPEKQITVLNNAIDTKGIMALAESITMQKINQIRDKFNIESNNVGVFCGAIYEYKRIDFLLKAAQLVRTRIPDFHLIIIGAGPDEKQVIEAAKNKSWIHYVGTQTGYDKVLYMKLGTICLIPGAVGLGILDAFSLGLPIVTTDCGIHGPEIYYLKHGENGFMTSNCIEEYCNVVVELLSSPRKLGRMKKNCFRDAQRYSIEQMADNFAHGIVSALAR